jgi:UDP-glucose 4-epimerase
LGSQAEYGPSRAPTAETEPTNPTTFYGAAKLAAAHAYGQIAARSGARYAWIRLFSSYGPKDGSAWMVPYLISALLKGEPPALTLGEQVWDYLYVEDAAAAIVAVMEHSAASGIFNLGSGQGLALRSFVESIRDAIDPALPLGFGDVAYRSDQVMHLQADVSRLKAIGWLPLTSIEHGVRSTVAWSRARQAQDPTRT